ncbi:type II toxin-antitoxin system HicB family antitoxin [Gordonia araii NBRC 100433]|nr:type II toxin-antitoxin system HicB family antitoxin [Gordonia araii NBRC 100433]
MRKVTAIATRSGEWWAVEVPEIDGLFTQAKRLEQIPDMVSDAAELLINEPVEVEVRPALGSELESAIVESRALSVKASDTQREAADHARRLVARLRGEGLTVRDVGVVLGVSPQRVSQLAGKG